MILPRPFSRRPGSEAANVLIGALVIIVVIGVSLAGYLTWAGTQNRLVSRAQAWNQALPLAEAGLEEAMSHLTTSPQNRLTEGWIVINGYYAKTRTLEDGYYHVRISTNQYPTIISQGFARSPLSGTNYISRTVQVTTTNDPIYFAAITVEERVDLNGNNVTVDSYDSTDPSMSTGGLYDPAKARDKGTVATNLGITNSLMVGNADIYGQVATGPGGTVQIGPNGAVGSTAWHNAGNNGIQPGWSRNDFNQEFEPMVEPTGGVPAAGGRIGSVDYEYILTSGVWQVPSVSGSVLVTGDAQLIVSGDVNMGDRKFIQVENGSKLKMWVHGTRAKFTSEGVNNVSGNPDAFHLYGTDSLTSIEMTGSVKFNGVINAPDSEVKIGGGGSAPIHVSGAILSKTVTMTGRINMHFDENLRRTSFKGFLITSWDEI